MFESMIRLSQLALPVFIFCTMANVGMTQDPKRIVQYWRKWPYYLKMVAANFLFAPAAMWVLLHFGPLPLEYKAGLAVFSLCAGAPFLIKLTAASEHDLALGAAFPELGLQDVVRPCDQSCHSGPLRRRIWQAAPTGAGGPTSC